MPLLPALIVLSTVLLLFATSLIVGWARGKYGIQAPATSGHPSFERAFRAQMNTLEQSVLFLPTFWLACQFGNPVWASVLGALWLLARVWYVAAYLQEASRRGGGFGLGMLAWAALLLQSIWGMAQSVIAH